MYLYKTTWGKLVENSPFINKEHSTFLDDIYKDYTDNHKGTSECDLFEELFSEQFAKHSKHSKHSKNLEYGSWWNTFKMFSNAGYITNFNPYLDLIFEFKMSNNKQRADLIVAGIGKDFKPTFLVVELKGKLLSAAYKSDEEKFAFAEDQLLNYYQQITKFTDFSEKFGIFVNFKKCLYFPSDTTFESSLDEGEICYGNSDNFLRKIIDTFVDAKLNEEILDAFLNSHFYYSDFSTSVEKVKRGLNACDINLTIKQKEVFSKILTRILLNESQQKKSLTFINGTTGSGKSLLGLQLVNLFSNENVKYYCKLGNYGNVLNSFLNDKRYSKMVTSNITLSNGEIFLVVIDEMQKINYLIENEDFSKVKHIVCFYDSRQQINPVVSKNGFNFKEYLLNIKDSNEGNIDYEEICLPQRSMRALDIFYHKKILNFLSIDNWEKLDMHSTFYKCYSEGDSDNNFARAHEELERKATEEFNTRWLATINWAKLDCKCFDIENCCINFEWVPQNEDKDWYLKNRHDGLKFVGTVYSTQGLELDYTGVIFWDDVRWDIEEKAWKLDISRCWDMTLLNFFAEGEKKIESYQDIKGYEKVKRKIIADGREQEVLSYILNQYYILLTRARLGCHIWFKDKATMQHFIES